MPDRIVYCSKDQCEAEFDDAEHHIVNFQHGNHIHIPRSEKMLSKRKMTEATATWIRGQLEEAQASGRSLKDDSDGYAIRVERVKQSGTLLFLDISCRDANWNVKDLEYCLLLQQKMPTEEPSKPVSALNPSQAELAELDDTA